MTDRTSARTSETVYSTIPALARYIDRIGAEQVNFKTFMVKEYKGHYYTERVLIKINADGSVSCNSSAYEPTKEEREQIRGALEKAEFPKSVNASRARSRDHRKTLKGTTYEFYSDTGDVIMIQERTVIKGNKAYVPWTYWSDGEWRRMEPERALPFWRPLESTSSVPEREREVRAPRIMIHEGAKASAAVTEIVKSKDRSHPWYEELICYEHWGMIGGALAPHRTDYAELVREKPTEVVYVCDNDAPGMAALQEVSKHYGGAMKGVYFDDRWPASWDLAEPMPKKFYKGERYVGPSLESMMKPATWATELVPNPTGKGRPLAVLRSSFVQKVFHSIKPEIFIHLDHPGKMWSASQFNSLVRPYSNVDDTVRLILAHDAIKSAVVQYKPNMPPGIYTDDHGGGRYINTYSPSLIKAEEGDVTPFLDYMEHLLPDPVDRDHMLKYVYNLVTLPLHGHRPHFAVLLVSETQGVGKSTLGEKILSPLVGRANVATPSENTVVEGQFNDWMAYKVLAVIHEIYAGQSVKAYDRLKNLITESEIDINQKYQDVFKIENWMHIFACSNSMMALRISNDDRRWFIPKVTEKKKPMTYWREFNIWLAEGGGLQAIKCHAEKWFKEHGPLDRGMNAPPSDQKKVFIEEGYSSGMLLVSTALKRLRAVLDHESTDEAKLRRTMLQNGLIYLIDDRKGKNSELRKLVWEKGVPNAQVRLDGPAGKETREVAKNGTIALRDTERLFAFVLDASAIELIKQKQYDGKHSDRLERPLTIRKMAAQDGWHSGADKVTIPAWGYAQCRIIFPYADCKDWPVKKLWRRPFPDEPESAANDFLPVDLALLHNDFARGQNGAERAA